MSRLSSSEARQRLPEALNQVAYGNERVVIHRRGKALAALVPIADLELLERIEDESDAAAVKKWRKSKGVTVSWETIKARLKL